MFCSVRQSEFSSDFDSIRGAAVYDQDDEKIGKVVDVLYDDQSGQARYAVVDAGGFRSDKYLLPIDTLSDRSGDANAFTVPYAYRDVETLPAYDEQYLTSDRWNDYETRYRAAWPQTVRHTGGFSERLRRFTDKITGRSRRDVTAIRSDERVQQETFRPTLSTDPALRERETVAPTPMPVPAPAMARVSETSTSNINSTPISVYGVFDDRDKLEKAVQMLKDEGFDSADISVVFPDQDRTERFALEHNTKAPEGAAAGGGTGIVVGGVLGWLAGIGMLAIPGIGPLVAAGPIVAALAGAGAGSVVGGLAGALIGSGMREEEAKYYENEIKSGRMLISVRCTDPRFIPSARSVLERADARDIFATGEQRAA